MGKYLFELKHEKDGDFSQMEFFAELRNHSVEHLGQVKLALLEADATLSILYFKDEEVKYGMPLFPDRYKVLESVPKEQPCACMYCGNVLEHLDNIHQQCMRCKRAEWTAAICTIRRA